MTACGKNRSTSRCFLLQAMLHKRAIVLIFPQLRNIYGVMRRKNRE